MFFGTGERIRTVRRMIMAGNTPDREAALADLLPFQRGDFEVGGGDYSDCFPQCTRYTS
jgi:hypothetical protein